MSSTGLILATGELGYAMALRGDLPRFMPHVLVVRNTPVAAQWLGSGLAMLLILANGSRSTADLFTFMILLVDRFRARSSISSDRWRAWRHRRP